MEGDVPGKAGVPTVALEAIANSLRVFGTSTLVLLAPSMILTYLKDHLFSKMQCVVKHLGSISLSTETNTTVYIGLEMGSIQAMPVL